MSTEKTNAPTEGRSAVVKCGSFARQRIAAAHRMEPLDCGCRDPWFCQCHHRPHVSLEARLAADRHLAAAGLAPVRRTA